MTKTRAAKKGWTHSDPKAWTNLESALKDNDVAGRTPSAAFLIWFLQDVYRLDAVEAHDAVCDRKLDKGIDALIVNDGLQEIVLFQTKRAEVIPATLGDKDLKQFVGALAQFRTEESVIELASKTRNDELKTLLKDNRVAEKVAKGYRPRPIFVANVAANDDAHQYIAHARRSGDNVDLWDLTRLTPVLDQLAQEWFVADEATLRIDPKRAFYEGQQGNPDILIAAVQAKELVKLPGISDTRIFAQNVRLDLGNFMPLGLGSTRPLHSATEPAWDTRDHPRSGAMRPQGRWREAPPTSRLQ
jgi:hypothetical protein